MNKTEITFSNVNFFFAKSKEMRTFAKIFTLV